MASDEKSQAPGHRRVRFEVGAEDEGLRLDQALARRVPDLSRRSARLAVELGGVFVDRARVKVLGRRVRAGQHIEIHLGGAHARASRTLGRDQREREARALPAHRIVHEDEDVIVVDKPSGLLTAPTPEGDSSNLADLLARREGRRERVWVVHRLDLETSGLLVFAKSALANRVLAERFRKHDVRREYLAVVAGSAPSSLTRIDEPIAGRAAITHVQLLEGMADASLLRLRLETGRTHQVRIHLSGVGHPVLGDRRWPSRFRPAPPRLALHATRLGFAHPRNGDALDFESAWPDELAEWLGALRAQCPGGRAPSPT